MSMCYQGLLLSNRTCSYFSECPICSQWCFRSCHEHRRYERSNHSIQCSFLEASQYHSLSLPLLLVTPRPFLFPTRNSNSHPGRRPDVLSVFRLVGCLLSKLPSKSQSVGRSLLEKINPFLIFTAYSSFPSDSKIVSRRYDCLGSSGPLTYKHSEREKTFWTE